MATTQRTYDRTAQDVGNILALEHINLGITDQAKATAFYVMGMGFTRDPYLMVGPDNMWVNAGRQQFHLPTMEAGQVLRGHAGIVVPDLAALRERLSAVAPLLAGTRFRFGDGADGAVHVTCPWGNRFRAYGPHAGMGVGPMGVGFVQLDVSPGTADGIAAFYTQVMRAPATVGEVDGARAATVRVGGAQRLVFRESDRPVPDYDGHHVAVYVTDFSGPHAALERRGLITEESNEHQYRFTRIVDPGTGRTLFELEHEVRSATHPMFQRNLVNRNPEVTLARYDGAQESLRV